jgi:hypothetical protein
MVEHEYWQKKRLPLVSCIDTNSANPEYLSVDWNPLVAMQTLISRSDAWDPLVAMQILVKSLEPLWLQGKC